MTCIRVPGRFNIRKSGVSVLQSNLRELRGILDSGCWPSSIKAAQWMCCVTSSLRIMLSQCRVQEWDSEECLKKYIYILLKISNFLMLSLRTQNAFQLRSVIGSHND